MSQRTTVRVVYEASGPYVFGWAIETAFLSLITLGLYLPIGLNNLVCYLCDCTELQMWQSEDSSDSTPSALDGHGGGMQGNRHKSRD